MGRAYRFEGYDVEPPATEELERMEEERYWASMEAGDVRYMEILERSDARFS